MHIVFDHQIFCQQQSGGISRYFLELAQNLPLLCHDIHTSIAAPFHISPLLENTSKNKSVKVSGKRFPSFPGKHHIFPIMNRLVGRMMLSHMKPDLIHETYYTDSPVNFDCPRILTVYDMIHERFYEYFEGVDCHIPQLKKKAVNRVDHIIAISKSTRDDVVDLLNIAPEKISVVPLASSLEKPATEKKEWKHRNPYLLYIGLRSGVKNFKALLSCYADSIMLQSNFDLICVGGGKFSSKENETMSNMGLTEKIIQLEADDSYLSSLYSNAEVFVYPSLYEGFGMPILEAMRCGCPVTCSNTSSMPEIAGDAALFFDPHDQEEMKSVLESVINSNDLAEGLRQRGYIQAKKYSWEMCVNQTAKIYRRYA